MKQGLGVILAGLAAVALPGAANAVVLDFDQALGSGGFYANVKGPSFSNSYTFDVTAPGFLGAALNSANVTFRPGLTFTAVTLNGTSLSLVPSVPGDDDLHYSLLSDIAAIVGTNTFFVSGTGSGSYSGTVAFTPAGGGGTPGAVPEPATWAMLIGGFGAVGGVMRRRRNTRVSVSYA